MPTTLLIPPPGFSYLPTTLTYVLTEVLKVVEFKELKGFPDMLQLFYILLWFMTQAFDGAIPLENKCICIRRKHKCGGKT